ncbi:MAG TPA: LytTR family DNA-binding domain-containing protein [Fusibacter sp.]|nr:LytTR family DNA-binding domain-containing protein [Fusibacter sp.]
MKIKLSVSEERYHEIKSVLEERGIEVDDTADFVLSEINNFIRSLTVREKRTHEKVIVFVEDIICIESYGSLVEVQTKDSLYQCTDRLYQIANSLDPKEFLRISNSVVISTSKVKQIKPTLSSKFILTLSNGKKVDVTRSYYHIFKDYFHI